MPEAILTDNGKVFTGRFGPGHGTVLFDRICQENGIRHLLTAPRSPTTTGKVERFHQTLKKEFLRGLIFDSLEDAQAQINGWVDEYNSLREHQSLGDRPPAERFALARREPSSLSWPTTRAPTPRLIRRVRTNGSISLLNFKYHVGRYLSRAERRRRLKTDWSRSSSTRCSWPPTPANTHRISIMRSTDKPSPLRPLGRAPTPSSSERSTRTAPSASPAPPISLARPTVAIKSKSPS